jgi:hypothetical protein
VRRQSIEVLRAAREVESANSSAGHGLGVLGGVRLEAENLNIFPTRIQAGVWKQSNSKLYDNGIRRGGQRTQALE